MARASAWQGRDGFTLLEVVVALAIITVAAMAAMRTLTSSSALGQTGGETSSAYHAARRVLERIKAEPFGDVFKRYNETGLDDGPPGSAPGAHFAVNGLDATPDDPDGFVGRVILPSDPGNPSVLREDLDDHDLGTPFDVNLDGFTDGLDHALDYDLLPIVVRIDWRGSAGVRTVRLATILTSP